MKFMATEITITLNAKEAEDLYQALAYAETYLDGTRRSESLQQLLNKLESCVSKL